MRATNKLILGTVQLGINYGINNITGRPTNQQSLEILKCATDNDILFLDTAEAYGNATEIIGSFHSNSKQKFSIITKFKYSSTLNIDKWLDRMFEALQVKVI